jgi:hypothetical protein
MGERHPHGAVDEFPAPGQYDPSVKDRVLLGKIMPEPDHEGSHPLVPGPGHYNPNFNLVEPTQPKYTVSESERFHGLPADQFPGPGSYNQ